MNNNQSIVVKKEWGMAILDILNFFLQHTSIEYDGKAQKATVNYNGPKGWNFSLTSTYSSVIDATPSADAE